NFSFKREEVTGVALEGPSYEGQLVDAGPEVSAESPTSGVPEPEATVERFGPFEGTVAKRPKRINAGVEVRILQVESNEQIKHVTTEQAAMEWAVGQAVSFF